MRLNIAVVQGRLIGGKLKSSHPPNQTPGMTYTPNCRLVHRLMPCSTTAVQEAVNFKVPGSNPGGAVDRHCLSYGSGSSYPIQFSLNDYGQRETTQTPGEERV